MVHTALSRRALCAALPASLSPWADANAQTPPYPSKAVMVRVAVPAGGPVDNALRAAQPTLQRLLGQPVVIENQPGANGLIALRSVLAAGADGHTLLGGPGTDFLLAPTLVAAAKYRPLDFKLVAVTGISDFVLVSRTAQPFDSLDGFLAYLRKPGSPELSIAHWGTGSGPHLVAADFMARTGTRFLEVPYKGAAPVLSDLSGGQVDLGFVPLTGPALSLVKARRLAPLAVTSPVRNAALPEVPVLGEKVGFKDFDHSVWSAVWAPPKTPDSAVERLTKAFNEWIVSPNSLARLAANASRRVEPRKPVHNAAFLQREYEKLAAIARALKLVAQW